eukprot:8028733-Karenia_brevis.AAC.1
MSEHGQAIAEHRTQGYASGNTVWDEQYTYQAQGMSHSGKNPAAATRQPYLVFTNFHSRKCCGWTSLEALATNPYCCCGAPFIIARNTITFWKGDGSLG